MNKIFDVMMRLLILVVGMCVGHFLYVVSAPNVAIEAKLPSQVKNRIARIDGCRSIIEVDYRGQRYAFLEYKSDVGVALTPISSYQIPAESVPVPSPTQGVSGQLP